MSGAGRHHRGKHVLQQHGDHTAEVADGEVLARCGANKGNCMFEVELVDGRVIPARMPRKLHRVVWLQRGDILVVSAPTESATDVEIVRMCTPEQLRHMHGKGLVPDVFLSEKLQKKSAEWELPDSFSSDPRSDSEEELEEGNEDSTTA
eukprot:PhM_4_TR15443/c0_g1_i1/m.78915/K15025/EIF1AD; probable RNA-binding protein EIF1AD